VRFRLLLSVLLIPVWLVTIACNLVRLQDTGQLPASEIDPVATEGWVAFTGRGVSMGAPSATWDQVPTDADRTQQRLSTFEQVDPSVANVYADLADLAANSFYRLVLIRTDGTAYATITARSLRPGQDQADAIDEAQQELLTAGIVPRQQRSLLLPEGDAVRWTIDVMPPGSQAINRQFQYLLVINNQLYTFTFSAQLPDFDDYAAMFETMALTFRVDA
jgi:hypothetical protein